MAVIPRGWCLLPLFVHVQCPVVGGTVKDVAVTDGGSGFLLLSREAAAAADKYYCRGLNLADVVLRGGSEFWVYHDAADALDSTALVVYGLAWENGEKMIESDYWMKNWER